MTLLLKSGARLIVIVGVLILSTARALSQTNDQSRTVRDAPWKMKSVSTQTFDVGGSTIQVDFAHGDVDLPIADILPWIKDAVSAVSTYYGRFPVPRVKILIVPVSGSGIHGTTWGAVGQVPAFTRVTFGEHTTTQDLNDDWTLTHEMVHTAFPSLPEQESWMEEGLATYVEPIARAQTGRLSARRVWGDLVQGLPQGEPVVDDHGMDETHSWGRTYWGGAMFCLLADVAIRQQTGNEKGLQDALRAIVASGGTIDRELVLAETLQVGDRATGTSVLTDMYKVWSVTPVNVDLPALWVKLGIKTSNSGIVFDSNAPLARIRDAITIKQAN
jgi:hypothetical protein